jgi:hypothetical protein
LGNSFAALGNLKSKLFNFGDEGVNSSLSFLSSGLTPGVPLSQCPLQLGTSWNTIKILGLKVFLDASRRLFSL